MPEFSKPEPTEEQPFPELVSFIGFILNQPEHVRTPIVKNFINIFRFWIKLNDEAWHDRPTGEDVSDLQIENKTYLKIIAFLEESFIRPEPKEEETE